MPDVLAPKLPEGFRSSRELFDDCLAAGDKYRQIRDTVESRRSDTWDADRRRAGQELLELNAEFDQAQKIEGYVREFAEIEARAKAAEIEAEAIRTGKIRGPSAAFLPTGGEGRTAGQIFTEDEGALERHFRTGEYGVEVRNLLTGTSIGTSGSNNFAAVGQPIYTPQTNRQRRLFVRDLLSVQETGLGSVPYIRELNAATNETGATAVAEASAKPEVTMEFERDDAPIRKIAAWLQATEEALSDAPTLRGYIDTRLGYMLMLREEAQVIGVGAGGGNAPNIKGILDFTGVQTNTGEFYDGVGVSIGKIENVDGDADGVAVNPVDFWAAVTDRHNTFYDGNAFASGGAAPFNAPAMTAWGLPVVRTRSLASGTAIVGAWALGATLFQREGVTIRTTDSHASLFVSNTWVILAEERIGLAVHRADFFVKLTVSAPS